MFVWNMSRGLNCIEFIESTKILSAMMATACPTYIVVYMVSIVYTEHCV